MKLRCSTMTAMCLMCIHSATTSIRGEGGTHEEGFKLALNRTLNNYAKEAGLLKKDEEGLQSDDVREGLTAIISVKHPDPQYEGQTKTKLGNVRGAQDRFQYSRRAAGAFPYWKIRTSRKTDRRQGASWPARRVWPLRRREN